MNQMMQHDLVGSPVAQDCGKDYGPVIGTPFKVFLSNGVVEQVDPATGKVATNIIDLPGLIAAIVESRVMHPRKLSGDDLKFIRSALRMKSVDVADVLDITPEHYSRCEAGVKTLSASSEKFYRMYVFLQAVSNHTEIQERLSKLDKSPCDPEEAKEALNAFKSVFFEMKIQHIFDPTDELEFSFGRRVIEPCDGCGPDDGKWEKQEAA